MFIIDTVLNTNSYRFEKLVKFFTVNYDIKKYDELPKMLVDFNINTCNKDGKNLLHLFTNKDTKIQKILLEHGININKKDNSGKTPIFYAQSSHYSFFIENGADLSVRDNDGHSVLHNPSRYYLTSCVLPLIHGGAVIDYSEYNQPEIFHKAILFRDTVKMKELLDPDANVRRTAALGTHPSGATLTDRRSASEACNNGAQASSACRGLGSVVGDDAVNVVEASSVNKSLANWTIQYKWLNTLELLTPLYLACNNELYEEFEILIHNGADVKEPGLLLRLIHMCHKITPIFIKIIKQLVELGSNIHDINDINCWGENILHKCNKSAELMEMFLKAGVNVHGRTKDIKYNIYKKETMIAIDAEPLQYVSMMSTDLSVYKLLFEYGADPNVQNSYGTNAFMGVCYSWFLGYFKKGEECDIIKLFLDNGANIYLKDNDGKTVFDYIYANYQLTDAKKAKIIKLIYEKEKFIILEPKTNEFVYRLLNNIKI